MAAENSRSVVTLVTGGGVTLTLQRDHGQDTLASLQMMDQGGQIVTAHLNRNNRRRLRGLLDLMDICDAE
jgi:hypothetical protein